MSRWGFLILCIGLFGFTPIYEKYDDPKVSEEIKNIENSFQPRQWSVFNNTPTLNDLQDGEFVVVSSNSWTAIMGRNGEDIYSIKLSCVTVIR